MAILSWMYFDKMTLKYKYIIKYLIIGIVGALYAYFITTLGYHYENMNFWIALLFGAIFMIEIPLLDYWIMLT